MEVVMKGDALRKFFEEIADAYYSVCPERAREFEEGVRQHQYGLNKPNGMSAENNFMAMCFLPEHLYAFVRKAGNVFLNIDDVWRDRKNFDLFFKVWKAAAIRRKLTQYLSVKN